MISSSRAAIVAALFVAQAGYGADSEGRFVSEGPGQTKCEAAFAPDTPEASQQRARLLAAWMTGYLTAHNKLLTDTFDVTPWQTPGTVLGLIRQYCAQNPDSTVSDAAQHLIVFLGPKRLTQQSPAVAIGTGDAQVVLYAEVVAAARTALDNAGISVGPGSEDLAEAIRSFQDQNALPVTGLLDQRTLVNLLK